KEGGEGGGRESVGEMATAASSASSVRMSESEGVALTMHAGTILRGIAAVIMIEIEIGTEIGIGTEIEIEIEIGTEIGTEIGSEIAVERSTGVVRSVHTKTVGAATMLKS
ncbi:MAG: hypothetical protein SGPRY_011778, partial [Prymnesium sp.]